MRLRNFLRFGSIDKACQYFRTRRKLSLSPSKPKLISWFRFQIVVLLEGFSWHLGVFQLYIDTLYRFLGLKSFFEASFPMKFLVDFFELGVGDVGVDLGRGDVFVPKHFLDCAQISATTQ